MISLYTNPSILCDLTYLEEISQAKNSEFCKKNYPKSWDKKKYSEKLNAC